MTSSNAAKRVLLAAHSMESALIQLAKDSPRGSCGDGTVTLAEVAYAVDGLTLRQALHLGLDPRARLTCLAY
jgi:hypothetical protein